MTTSKSWKLLSSTMELAPGIVNEFEDDNVASPLLNASLTGIGAATLLFKTTVR